MLMPRFATAVHVAAGLAAFALAIGGGTSGMAVEKNEKKVAVKFSGGHEIGKEDFGRPIVLMAAGLGVKPEVFREAFSGVTPARGRGPTGEEARRNKQALMKALAPYGVTNERMDEVADYYRFRPDRDELWPTTPAKAHAIVENGKVKKIVVTEPGSGYCSPPDVTVEGFGNGTGSSDLKLKATLGLSKDLKKNGTIAAVEIVPPAKPKRAPAR
jgi:hypothetical protein